MCNLQLLLKFLTDLVEVDWLLMTNVRAVKSQDILRADPERKGKMTLEFKKLCGLANCECVIDFVRNNTSYEYECIESSDANADAYPRARDPLSDIEEPSPLRGDLLKLVQLARHNRVHSSIRRRQQQRRR